MIIESLPNVTMREVDSVEGYDLKVGDLVKVNKLDEAAYFGYHIVDGFVYFGLFPQVRLCRIFTEDGLKCDDELIFCHIDYCKKITKDDLRLMHKDEIDNIVYIYIKRICEVAEKYNALENYFDSSTTS
jgi:hypothetical protein